MPLALQLAAASWRFESFKSIDIRVTVPQRLQLFQRIISTVTQELNFALRSLPGPTTFPDSFGRELKTILKTAYNWNRTVKVDILKYDFEPFIVEPFSHWDQLQMKSFERLRSPVRPDRKVISSVSLGLIGSVSLGGARVSRVQRKARVLVEDCQWFHYSPPEPTASATNHEMLEAVERIASLPRSDSLDVLEQLPILKEHATDLSGMYSCNLSFQDISKVYFQVIGRPMHLYYLINRHPPTTCPLGRNGITS